MRLGYLALVISVIASPVFSAEGAWKNPRMTETLRIGQLDGPDEYIFGSIRDIAVGLDGAIYVADAQTVRVRQYAADGRYVRDIGRIGEAPGEYRQIFGIKCLPDGQLVLFSSNPHRISIYGPDGTYRTGFNLRSTVFANRMLEFDVEGHIYTKDLTEPPSPDKEWSFALLESSQLGDSIGIVQLPKREPQGIEMHINTDQGPIYPFTIETCFSWSPLGCLIVGRNDTYALDVIDKRGRKLFHLQRPFQRLALAPEERADWQAWFESRSRQPDGTKASFDVAKMKPVFRGIFVGDEGRIWVSRYVAAENRNFGRKALNWREPTTFDVFEPDGRFLGTLVVPLDVQIMVWRGSEMWGVFSGDDGPQVVRYRIDTN